MAPSESARLIRGEDGVRRCWWGAQHEDYAEYHDTEWGLPATRDAILFEKICLEGFQAGLSWLTILRKRPDFRRVFADFDIDRVARLNQRSVDRLLRDATIVRHRGKIESTIHNARRAKELRAEFGTLSRYFWHFEPPRRPCPIPVPPTSDASIALSRDRPHTLFFKGPGIEPELVVVNSRVVDGRAALEPTELCVEPRYKRVGRKVRIEIDPDVAAGPPGYDDSRSTIDIEPPPEFQTDDP